MYSIFVTADNEEVKGDINMISEIVECYTDDPSAFLSSCEDLNIGQRKIFSNYISDLVIVKRIS
jgi:hypothetical protein